MTVESFHRYINISNIFHSVSLCILLCFGLSSCSPWDRNLDDVYQAARKGNKNAMYAVVMHYEDFRDIVPLDSFKCYRNILVESGNHEVITNAWLTECAEYRKSHPGLDAEKVNRETDAIALKWNRIGAEYNDAGSYYALGSHYEVQYTKNRHPEDSLKAMEYYQKAWENWHAGERIRRDREAGIIPLVRGGIAYGCHVYQTTEHESFIPRLFNAGIFFSEYVMSGLLKLLFTAQWWKVLLTVLLLTVVMSVPMMAVRWLYDSSSVRRNSMGLGMMLGFWNLILIFVAYCNENPNWVSNVGALWFPEASYGLQPYLCVIPNLFLLFLLLGNMVWSVWECIKQGKGIGKAILSAAGLAVIFTVNYLMAGIAGLFYLFIVILVILVKSVVGSVPEAIGTAVGASFQRQEEHREKACANCRFYEVSSGHCGMTDSNRDRYGTDAYSCPYYS